MPTIQIDKPFNFREGVEVKHYKAGKQQVSEAVAAHAKQHGFAAEQSPKPAPDKAAEKQ